MANQSIKIIDSAEHFQTESLRLTAFLPPAEKVGEQKWWSELTGLEPDIRNARPQLGHLQEAGPVGGYGLVLTINPGRVDWFLTPRPREGFPPEQGWAGPLSETLPFFLGLMTKWLDRAPAAARLALGVIVHQEMPDRESSYRKLAQLLPAVEIDPVGSSEFIYQINRPRTSKSVEGLKINRLSKWFSALMVPFSVSLSFPGQAQLGRLSAGETTCRIELDINTDSEFSGNPDLLRSAALLAELRDLALEIITVGEIP